MPGERGDRGLRSDHAAAGATPRVSLEFTAQGGRYRVAREPYHEAAEAAGRRGHHAAPPRPPWCGSTPATRPPSPPSPPRCATRSGGSSGSPPTQFQQVILLPQGQFEEVLRGRPETREGLLKTLFHTVGFEQLTDWLADQARAQPGGRRRAPAARSASWPTRPAAGAPS